MFFNNLRLLTRKKFPVFRDGKKPFVMKVPYIAKDGNHFKKLYTDCFFLLFCGKSGQISSLLPRKRFKNAPFSVFFSRNPEICLTFRLSRDIFLLWLYKKQYKELAENMTRQKNSMPRKVEFARDAIINYIHDHRLSAGDRLPSYSQLRKELDLGSQTISDAIASLCSLGVLEVRDKVGIFVLDPAVGSIAGRTIGIAVRQLASSAYSATLAGYIQSILNLHSCRCLTFYQQAGVGTDGFPGLAQSIAEHRFDGLIALCPLGEALSRSLAEAEIPCCFVGDDDELPADARLSVVMGVKEFLTRSRAELLESGCQRIVQLCVSAGQARRREYGIPALIGRSFPGGEAVAAKLLAIDPAERPDGVICDDDTVVSGLISGLIRAQLPDVRYMPRICSIIHRELGESYPVSRMVIFEQSVEEYARMAVHLLLEVLREGRTASPHRTCRFNQVERLESCRE